MGKYSLTFFYCIFRQLFFFLRPLRGRFLTFFSISREKKDEKTENLSKTYKKKRNAVNLDF